MKRVTDKKKILCGFLFLLSLTIPMMNGFCQSNSHSAYEAYYLYVNNYPDGAVSWGENQREVQGITHDDNNWYITATDRKSWINKDIDNCFLWKIPKGEDLNQNVDKNPRVRSTNLYILRQLWNGNDPLTGYIHWGDLDHYQYRSHTGLIDYLIIPVTSPKLQSPAVVFIRASDLTVAGIGYLPGEPGTPQKDVGWCAIHSKTGDLFTSDDLTNEVLRYRVPWEKLPGSGYLPRLFLTWICTYPIIDGFTNLLNSITFHNMQGGEFTPSGELLYVSNGRGRCKGQGASDPGDPNDGINVLEFYGGYLRRIRHSYNKCYGGPGNSDCDHGWADSFDFSYDFGCGKLETHSDQPEGLTIWDLDFAGIPKISGQLHVLIASVGLMGNMAQLQHFSGRIFVDQVNGIAKPTWNSPLPGTIRRPFKSIMDAVNWYPAWDGAEIMVKGALHPESYKFSKRIRAKSY